MTTLSVRSEIQETAASHVRIVDAFIKHVMKEIDRASGEFERESLTDLLEKLIEDRKQYSSIAGTVAVNAA